MASSGSANEGLDPRSSDARRVAAAAFVGTALEWYDFFLYGTAAAFVIEELYFPSVSPTAASLFTFSTFAAGFFARPLGGIVFGHFGDRLGRRQMLIISLTMMGVATAAIGLVPSYETLGVTAPVLLLLLRIVQGLGVGGEWGGAVLMATEHAPAGKRGLYGALPQLGVPAGLLLSNAVVLSLTASMSNEAFLSYGWRIPFLISIVLVGVGLYIRLRILESPAFENVKQEETQASVPLKETLRNHPRAVLTAMAARIGENALFYLFTVFILEYGQDTLGLGRTELLIPVMIASAIGLVTVPLFGALSDRLGRRPVYLFGAIVSLGFSFAYIPLLDTKQFVFITLATVVGLNIGHDAMYGPQGAFFSESFGTRTRYTGASLGYQLGAPLGGGIAPLIAISLLELGPNGTFYVALYMAVCCLITVVGVLAARETYEIDIEEDLTGRKIGGEGGTATG